MLCELFHFNRPQNVIFTMNITQSLNFLIKGFWGPGDHVLVSEMEHNAVMAPAHSVGDIGVTFTRDAVQRTGRAADRSVGGAGAAQHQSDDTAARFQCVWYF